MKGYASNISLCDPVVKRYVYVVMAACCVYVYFTKVDPRRAEMVQRWAMNGLQSSSGVLDTLWSMGTNYFSTNMGIVQSVVKEVSFDFLVDLNATIDFVSNSLGKLAIAGTIAWVMCTVVTQVYNLTALSLRYPYMAAAVGTAAMAMHIHSGLGHSMMGGEELKGGKRKSPRRRRSSRLRKHSRRA